LKSALTMPYTAHPTAVIDEGSVIGNGTIIWHFSHIMAGCRIGEACNIGQNVVVSPGVTLGRNVKVQNNVSIYTGVECEDDVFLGPSCVFTNVVNPRSAVPRRDRYVRTRVCQGATIGANATILCGITLGRHAFIGAGAVVTKDVPDHALMVGNPARRTGWMSEHGHKLVFNGDDVAVCPESGWTYVLTNGNVARRDAGTDPA
jgi:UDP-2-acetamido-3-amino-2,3-dideoxy-glucuronate N-acetyltransferase